MATSFTPERIRELQDEMHQAFRRWGQSHVDKPGSGISLVPYDPVKWPEQSLTVGKTDAWTAPLPDRLATRALKDILLAKAVGGRAVAAALVNDFKPISDEVAYLLDSGKNVAMIPAHKHYADIGIGAGALAVAMGKKRYIKENVYQSVNKLMTREKYNGIRIARFTAATGQIVWVIPSDGGLKWQVPSQAMYVVGKTAQEILQPRLEDPNTGVLFSVALTGGALDEVKDERQNVTGYQFRDIPPTLGSSMAAYDAAIPFAFDKASSGEVAWEVGDIITPPIIEPGAKPAEVGRYFTDTIYFDLQQRMERILAAPVGYNPISAIGKSAMADTISRESYRAQS